MAYAIADDGEEVGYDSTLRRFPRAFQPWKTVDELALRALVHAGASEQEVADRLGRPPLDIRSYRSSHGI